MHLVLHPMCPEPPCSLGSAYVLGTGICTSGVRGGGLFFVATGAARKCSRTPPGRVFWLAACKHGMPRARIPPGRPAAAPGACRWYPLSCCPLPIMYTRCGKMSVGNRYYGIARHHASLPPVVLYGVMIPTSPPDPMNFWAQFIPFTFRVPF